MKAGSTPSWRVWITHNQVMMGRIDRLAKLGQPLLHSELEKIIARVRRHGRIAGLIEAGMPRDALTIATRPRRRTAETRVHADSTRLDHHRCREYRNSAKSAHHAIMNRL
ncbi:MAG: hypothetical protein ACKV2U_33290 [Bryobacteraceae bacterium]